MTTDQILDKLPYKLFPSRLALEQRNKQAILNAGHIPIRAILDDSGDCVICGEAGRCPGWHTKDDLPKLKIAIQCTDVRTGRTGDFGFWEGEPMFSRTPVFLDLPGLFGYLKDHEISYEGG